MKKLYVIIYLFVSISLLGQNVLIREVIDANLFRLSDGRIIKLAGIDSPTDSSSIPYLRKVAESSKSLANQYLKMTFVMDSLSTLKDGTLLVFLYRKYMLQEVNFSEMFLRYGYGKYVSNFSKADSTELQKAEQSAIKNDNGIWKFFTPTKKDTLDNLLGSVSQLQYDSTKLENNFSTTPIGVKITFETLAGSVGTFLSGAAGFGVVALINRQNDLALVGGFLIGLAAGYVFAFPYIIYALNSKENPNLNVWHNYACSWGLTLITGAASYFVKESGHPLYYLTALSPIIGSMLYTHLLAPQSPAKDATFLLPDKKISSFHEFRNQQTMQLELLRIKF